MLLIALVVAGAKPLNLMMTETQNPQKSGHSPEIAPSAILAVIPALNEARHIETCIRSLMTGSPDLRRVPLLVADGGSSDETVAIVEGLKGEFPNLGVIHNPKRLQSAALNLAAINHAVPEQRILVRCDAHSIYPPDFILNVARSLVNAGAASLVVPMDAVGETCFEKANAWIVDTPLGSGGAAHRGGKASGWVDHGHHAGFNLDWYRRIGGYDETFSHNEDAEYDARLAQAGGSIYLDAGIRIKYIPRGDTGRLWKQYFGYGKGRARNALKHGSKLKLRQTAPILALAGSVAGLAASLVYWPAMILPAGYAGILLLASLWTAWKYKSACGLMAGLAAGTMHMAWAAGFLSQTIKQKTG
jgi:succinoglycan biosynthesis protein ExoA